jgi:hypothetical protein
MTYKKGPRMKPCRIPDSKLWYFEEFPIYIVLVIDNQISIKYFTSVGGASIFSCFTRSFIFTMLNSSLQFKLLSSSLVKIYLMVSPASEFLETMLSISS